LADIDQLVKKCRSEVKMRPVLPLGQPMPLGSVGYLDGHAFRYVGTTDSLLDQRPAKPIPGEGRPAVEIVSGRDVTLSFHGKGESSQVFGDIAKGKARVEVTFNSEKSFLLAADILKIRMISEPSVLLAAMLRAYKAGVWEERYCFVFQVATVASYTAVLSRQAGAKLLLSVSAKIGSGPVSVGDMASGARFERQSGAVERIIAQKGTVAFYNAYRVKDSWFKAPKIEVATALAPDANLEEQRHAFGEARDAFEVV
jgi:hypothetical protein